MQKTAFLFPGGSSSGRTVILTEIVTLGGGIIKSCATRELKQEDFIGDEVAYDCISKNKFESLIANNEMVRYVEFDSSYRGMTNYAAKKALTNHDFAGIGVNEIGLIGYKKHLESQNYKCVIIFVTPFIAYHSGHIYKNITVLKKRMIERNFSTESISARLKEAQRLYERMILYPELIDETIITNDSKENTREQTRNLLKKYNCI